MFKRIDHTEITTGNIEKTISFYTEILGFKVKQRIKMDRPPLEEIAFLTLNDTMLEVLGVKEPAPLSEHPWQVGFRMMALEVDDMDKTIDYLKSKGVQISREPITIGKSKRAEIKDHQGLTIELRQW